MRFDALTASTWISTCRVTTHKEAAAEAIRATVTYLTAVQHTGSYGLESKPTKHRSSNKAGMCDGSCCLTDGSESGCQGRAKCYNATRKPLSSGAESTENR